MKHVFSTLALLAIVFAAANAWAQKTDHSVEVGFRWNHINTESEKVFDLHSPSVGYTFYWVNPFGIMVNVSGFWPLSGQQDGVSHSLTRVYEDGVSGGDVAVNAAWVMSLAEKLDLVLAAGLHFNGMMLESSNVIDWYSATMGLGASALIRGHLRERLSVGGNVHTGWDFVDFIHGGDLNLAFTLGVSATIGVHFD